MDWQAWFTLATIGLVIAAMMTNRIGLDVAMVGGLALLMLFGIIDVPAATKGFAHPAVLMIAGLFVVAAGLTETGGMEMIAYKLLGRPKSIVAAQLRLMVPVSIMSGVMNNTPIVAMYLPIVGDWAKKIGVSPSKLLMPLSFGAILGGKLTLIGTASNIVVMGLYMTWLKDQNLPELSATTQFWGVALIGVPCLIGGILFIVATSKWLLPERRPADADVMDARQYRVTMEVRADSPIVGKSIEEAGLRQLPGLYLIEVERADGGDQIPAPSPDVRINAGDHLSFAGVLDSVVDLRKIRGLVPATDQIEKVDARIRQRTLVEAVVSNNSPLVRRTVRETQFRTVYNAAIIAVHRKGQQVRKKIGDIVLQPGDTLLLETHTGFVSAYRNSDDFFLVSNVEDSTPIRHELGSLALVILVGLVVMLMLPQINNVTAVFVAAMAMIVTRCCTGTIAKKAINWQVLLVLAAALGIGEALRETGAADFLAHELLAVCSTVGLGPRMMLFVIFMLSSLFAQLVTNYGAAVLMFPIAMATALDMGADPLPFMFMTMVGAGSSFMTPVSYQTNLMVYGPGGYRFTDFFILGAPLTLLAATIATIICPIVFPL